MGVIYSKDRQPIATFPILPREASVKYYPLIEYAIPAETMRQPHSPEFRKELEKRDELRQDFNAFLTSMDEGYDERQFLVVPKATSEPKAFTARELVDELEAQTITEDVSILFLGPTVYNPTLFATSSDSAMISQIRNLCREHKEVKNGEVHETALGSGYMLFSAATTWLTGRDCTFSGSDLNSIATAFATYNFNHIHQIPAQFFTTNSLESRDIEEHLRQSVLLFGNSPASDLSPTDEALPTMTSFDECYDYRRPGYEFWENLATYFSQRNPQSAPLTCFWNDCTDSFKLRFQSILDRAGRYSELWGIHEVKRQGSHEVTQGSQSCFRLFEVKPRDSYVL